MPFKANNNREAVIVCAKHVVKRPSKRSVLVWYIDRYVSMHVSSLLYINLISCVHIFSSFFKNKICQNYLFVFRYVCMVCDSQWRNKSYIGVCAKFTEYGVIKIHDKSAFLVLFQVNGDNTHSFLTVTQLVTHKSFILNVIYSSRI